MRASKNTGYRPPSRETFLKVHGRLCDAYGCPVPYHQNLDPLSELISALLSHRTRNEDSAAAYRELTGRFPNWELVRDADPSEVEAAVARCTWPEQKGPRVQQVLREITRRVGALDLSFLADMPPEAAREWLEELPGVGPKTSAAVVSFSQVRGRALAVDSHHHRVAQRLGWIPANMGVGPSHAALESLLPEEWGAQQVYDHHEVMMFHGRRTCFWRDPACQRCVVLQLCPTGQERIAEGIAARAKLL